MNPLIAYNIPVYGIKFGMHQYEFRIEKLFFEHFPSELIQDGAFVIKVDLDKRPDMLVVDFHINGTQRTACDRCLEMINLPVDGNQQLIFKYAQELVDDAEVVDLPVGTKNLNLAKYIHESICLALPLIRSYDCENDDPMPCNTEILKYLVSSSDHQEKDAPEKNPIWDELNKLDKSIDENQ